MLKIAERAPDSLAKAETVDPQFRADVLAGLAATIPAIPARWFYDRRGSELFDDITRLPSYYPTRTEAALLAATAGDIAAASDCGCALIEFGSGSSTKTPLLLEALRPAAYVPIDISGDYLRDSAAALAADYPAMKVLPVEADFTTDFALPDAVTGMPLLGFFSGSTIGNFVPRTATDLLRHFRAMLGTGSRLLIGMDRVKSIERLLAAYDDPEGVTAQFNLNLLDRINRELAGDIPVDAFAHEVRWNDMLGRIEMHLRARREVAFTIAGNHFTLAQGRTIHTENSHKYDQRGGRLLLLAGGWTPIAEWTDPAQDFALVLAEALPNRFAP